MWLRHKPFPNRLYEETNMTSQARWRMLAIAAAFVCVLTLAHAANTNGRIKGVVTDAQGAVIANAQVTATNDATSVKFETQSGTDGNYLFPELPIGTYTVAASSTGFKSFTATGIVLN